MAKTNIKHFCLSFLILSSFFIFAQENNDLPKKYFLIGIRYNYGNIIAHTPEIADAAKSNPFGIQADLSWHFNTEKAFRYCNCLPRLGLSIHYWNFQNEVILGEAISVMAFAEPFFNLYRKLNFSIRPGFGIAYMSNPYDPEENPLNLAYSTHIGFSLLLNATIYYRVTDQLVLNAAINYNHISNGGVKLPNKGLNYPTISGGLDISLKPLKFNRFDQNKQNNRTLRKCLTTTVFLGFKGLLIDNKTYPVYGFLVNHLWPVAKNSLVNAGLEFDIDQTKVKVSEIYEAVSPDARYILALTGGYEHSIGKFGLCFDLGLYLRNTDQNEDIVFQRYGAKFYINKRIFAGISLRAHRHHAEFFDIRIGYSIFTSK